MALISKDGLTTVDQLAGLQVGDLQGNIWNKDMKEVLGGDYKLYRSADQVIKDLKNGRVEVAVSTTGAAASLLSSGAIEGYQVTALAPDARIPASQKPPQAAFMTSKDNPELTAAINEAIAQFRADGTLEQLLTQYGFPVEIANTGEPYFS
jgi:polar amino acid transport system substrate-binding protein